MIVLLPLVKSSNNCWSQWKSYISPNERFLLISSSELARLRRTAKSWEKETKQPDWTAERPIGRDGEMRCYGMHAKMYWSKPKDIHSEPHLSHAESSIIQRRAQFMVS